MSLLSKHRKKPYKTAEVGEWLFEWHYNEKNIKGCYLSIKAKSGNFSLTINGSYHAYGYLLAALEQGKTEQLHGFIAMLYVTATTLTVDQGFVDDMNKAIGKFLKRLDKKASSAAKDVTEVQDQADAALMEDIVSELDMSEDELKTKREADRQIMKEVLTEQENK